MNKLISVVLPVYNGGEYLKYAIESILNQSLKDFELIIINDGSSDDSLKTINHYAYNDDRIVVINRENKGLIYTLNEAIEQSTGKYIARMDQDDVSMKDRLSLQYTYMQEHKLDICGGNYTVIDESSVYQKSYNVFQKDFEILLTMASNVPFPHPSVMMRRSFLEDKGLKYGLNRDRQAEDLDLWIHMYNTGARFSNVNATVLQYRILNTSLSRVNHKNIIKESNNQFDLFVQNNKSDFKLAFESFFSTNNSSYELEKVAVKAALRYALLNKSFDILYKCIKKVTMKSFLIGSLSFIKMKFSI